MIGGAAVALLVPAIALAVLLMRDGHDPARESGAPFAWAEAQVDTQLGESRLEWSTSIAIVATDNRFDLAELRVPAGSSVTVELRNDGTVRHNWHVRGSTAENGNEVATRLVPRGETDTITFAIPSPGRYDFVCGIHPAEQFGVLIVS